MKVTYLFIVLFLALTSNSLIAQIKIKTATVKAIIGSDRTDNDLNNVL